jgi:HSP20 family protein
MATAKIEKQGNDAAEGVRQRPAVTPRVDVFENDSEYLLLADLPGVGKDGLQVHLHEGELTLEGRCEQSAPGAPLAAEYRTTDYVRKFAVPRGIDPEKIDAALTDGVLRLRMPKAEALKPRQIPIRPG